MRYLPILLILAACATAPTSTPSAGPSEIGGMVPEEIPEEIRDYFATTYLDRPEHKAFALAIGNFPEDDGFASGIGYRGDNPQGAMNEAIKYCENTKKDHEVVDLECLIYAVNDTVVWGMSDEEFQAVVDSY